MYPTTCQRKDARMCLRPRNKQANRRTHKQMHNDVGHTRKAHTTKLLGLGCCCCKICSCVTISSLPVFLILVNLQQGVPSVSIFALKLIYMLMNEYVHSYMHMYMHLCDWCCVIKPRNCIKYVEMLNAAESFWEPVKSSKVDKNFSCHNFFKYENTHSYIYV